MQARLTPAKASCLLVCLSAFLGPSIAEAGSLTALGGLEVQDTSWRADTASSTTLKLGYQWSSWSAYFLSELGYAGVDERVLQHLELGTERWLALPKGFAFARAGLSHRHEVPGESIDADVTAALGFGDGIRHRAGAAGALGWLYPFASLANGDVFASVEANTDVLAGAAGPRFYWGLGMGLGFRYDLDGGAR